MKHILLLLLVLAFTRGNDSGAATYDKENRFFSEDFGEKSRVVADQHAGVWFFRAHDVPRNRARNCAHIRERKIIRDHPAPAICAKFDCAHGSEVYAKRIVAGRRGLEGLLQMERKSPPLKRRATAEFLSTTL